MTLPVFAGKNGAGSILQWYDGKGVFTEEQLGGWVLDGGTRFVPPDDERLITAERQALTDEDVLRAQPALGDAVEQLDLAGCELLTDATVIEIGPRCPNLRVAMLGRVHLRRRARPLPLHRLMSPALSYRGRVQSSNVSKLTDPSIIALANACKSLVTLDLQYASSRADPRSRIPNLTRASRPPPLSSGAATS